MRLPAWHQLNPDISTVGLCLPDIYKNPAVLHAGPGSHTPQTAMSLAEELTVLRRQVREQEKEIRRLKEEKEFLEEASAFFAASRRRSAKGRE